MEKLLSGVKLKPDLLAACHVLSMYRSKSDYLHSMQETWQDMEKLVDDGLVKSIGISNFSVKKTQDLLSYARIKPVANQVEVHPYFRNSATTEFCQSQVMFDGSTLSCRNCPKTVQLTFDSLKQPSASHAAKIMTWP